MDNPRPDKVAKVDEIATKLESAGTVVVTEYRGLPVPAQAELRAAVREAGGEYKIYKNTLTKLAAERVGVELSDHLVGPTGLAFAFPDDAGTTDPVGLSKALAEFSKTNAGLVVKGGLMDGAVIGAADVEALAKIPPREEMLAMFAGLLQAPMAKFAGLLQAMPRDFAGLVKALIEKGGAGEAIESTPAGDVPSEQTDESPKDDSDETTEPVAGAETELAEGSNDLEATQETENEEN